MNESEKITVTLAQMECGMCPTIISGKTIEGWTIYARYRWGLLSVRIDPRDPAPFCGAAGVWIMAKQIDPEGLDGWMEYDEIKQHTSEMVTWPDELSPRNHDESEGTTWPDDSD